MQVGPVEDTKGQERCPSSSLWAWSKSSRISTPDWPYTGLAKVKNILLLNPQCDLSLFLALVILSTICYTVAPLHILAFALSRYFGSAVLSWWHRQTLLGVWDPPLRALSSEQLHSCIRIHSCGNKQPWSLKKCVKQPSDTSFYLQLQFILYSVWRLKRQLATY